MNVSGIALGGLDQALAQFQEAVTGMVAASDPTQSGGDIIDLSAAAVSMLAARNSVGANVQMLKVADDMERRVMDVLA